VPGLGRTRVIPRPLPSEPFILRFPSVKTRLKPWAERFNPFGVGDPTTRPYAHTPIRSYGIAPAIWRLISDTSSPSRRTIPG
jgi:hypothetical protein